MMTLPIRCLGAKDAKMVSVSIFLPFFETCLAMFFQARGEPGDEGQISTGGGHSTGGSQGPCYGQAPRAHLLCTAEVDDVLAKTGLCGCRWEPGGSTS